MPRKEGKSATSAGSAGGGFGSFASSSDVFSLSYIVVDQIDSFGISDPNVVVSLKGVLKKDPATKAKALQELISYAQSHPFEEGGVEDPVLEAWVSVYPRTSIDNARRVRELAHQLQFALMKSARKRMDRLLPKVVATWLAGSFDRDRGVAKAASDGINSFVNTPEKTKPFWFKSQGPILDFVMEAIKETVWTLSDNRSTSKEDAEEKYYRVLDACHSLVLGLEQRLDAEELKAQRAKYEAYFASDSVWKSGLVENDIVRRTIYQMLELAIDRMPDIIEANKEKLSKLVISALKIDQSRSAQTFVKLLTTLSTRLPDVWSTSHGGKKTPYARLQGFVEEGSRDRTPGTWELMVALVQSIPQRSISAEDANNFLKSMRKGIAAPDEPRSNASQAWTCYIKTAKHLLSLMDPEDVAAKVKFLEVNVLPITRIHLFGPADTKESPEFSSATNVTVSAIAYDLLASSDVPQIVEMARKEWRDLGKTLETRVTSRVEERTEEYNSDKSENANLGRRWFLLYTTISAVKDRKAPDLIREPSVALLLHCCSELGEKDFKNSSLATILADAVREVGFLVRGEPKLRSAIMNLFGRTEADLERPLTSLAATDLLSLLAWMPVSPDTTEEYKACWERAVTFAINKARTAPSLTVKVLDLLIDQKTATLARHSQSFQEFAERRCLAVARGEEPIGPLLNTFYTYGAVREETAQRIVSQAAALLDNPAQGVEPVLSFLGLVAATWSHLIIADPEAHTRIVTALLETDDTGNAPGPGAGPGPATFRAILRTTLTPRDDGPPLMVHVVQSNLRKVAAASRLLKIDTVCRLARELVEERGVDVASLLPDLDRLTEELKTEFGLSLMPTAHVIGNLPAGAALISDVHFSDLCGPHGRRDAEGFPRTLRAVVYMSNMIAALPWCDAFQAYLYPLALTVEFVNDQMSGLGTDGEAPSPWNRSLFFLPHLPESRAIAQEFVSKTRQLFDGLVKKASGDWWNLAVDTKDSGEKGSGVELGVVRKFLNELLGHSVGLEPESLYAAKALRVLVQGLVEDHGIPPADADKWLAAFCLPWTPELALRSMAVVGALEEHAASSATLKRLCNDHVACITSMAKPDAEDVGPRLVDLETIAAAYPAGELPVANHRIVMLVKHLCKWMDGWKSLSSLPDRGSTRATQMARLLRRLLACVADMYDSFWIVIIKFYCNLISGISRDELLEKLPLIDVWFKLEHALESLSDEHNDNDELIIALRETRSTRQASVMHLLRTAAMVDSQMASMLMLATLLRRRAAKIPSTDVNDVTDLFELVASTSTDIQTAGFNLIHEALPRLQDRDFIELQDEGENARLPDELMSLLLEAPKAEDEDVPGFATHLRSYLLAWVLIFDHFKTVAATVHDAYVERLKEQDAVAFLLELAFDLLGHSNGKPLDMHKAGITPDMVREYVSGGESEFDVQHDQRWLLFHVCYLCMRHTPGLFRAWYLGCESKQTKIAVEGWVRKYMTPMLFEDHANAIRRWLAETESGAPGAEERDIDVSISDATREITASYELEDQRAAIAFRVPAAYPLDLVVVEGVNRVGVGEQLWQTWVRSVQGVVTFTHGSLLDGVVAFQRTAAAHLKGKSECAICYAIVAPDRTLPDKRCETCRNLFHRHCLYQWFQRSGQNKCPLCRNPISMITAADRKKTGTRRSGASTGFVNLPYRSWRGRR